MSRPWIALFSRTGKEIYDIVEATGREPDILVTNASPDRINAGIFALRSRLLTLPKRPEAPEYNLALGALDRPIVTLHGWLRIVPAEICTAYEMYNGHPALITKYPELKGLDMQEAIVDNADMYPEIGSVIHRVTPVLDDGEVLYESSIPNTAKTIDDAYTLLRQTSLDTWLQFASDYSI